MKCCLCVSFVLFFSCYLPFSSHTLWARPLVITGSSFLRKKHSVTDIFKLCFSHPFASAATKWMSLVSFGFTSVWSISVARDPFLPAAIDQLVLQKPTPSLPDRTCPVCSPQRLRCTRWWTEAAATHFAPKCAQQTCCCGNSWKPVTSSLHCSRWLTHHRVAFSVPFITVQSFL